MTFKELFEAKIYDEDIEHQANISGTESWDSNASVTSTGKIKEIKIVYKKSGETSAMKLKRNANPKKSIETNEFVYILLKPKGDDFIIKEIEGNLETNLKKNQKLTRQELINLLKNKKV